MNKIKKIFFLALIVAIAIISSNTNSVNADDYTDTPVPPVVTGL